VDGHNYRITVKDEISDSLGATFSGMALKRRAGKSELAGWVRDQAELQGLLKRVCDCGMTLLSVTALGDDADGS